MIVPNQRLCFGLLFLAIVLTIVLTRPDHKEQEVALERLNRDSENSFHGNDDIKAAAIPSHEEIRDLRYTLERDGAMAEVVVNVSDRWGNPIQGASVRLYFNQPEGTDKAKGVVEGFTDSLISNAPATCWNTRRPPSPTSRVFAELRAKGT